MCARRNLRVGRHNFKGSTAISQKCLQNISCTARNSITASVLSKDSSDERTFRFIAEFERDDACLLYQVCSAKALIRFDVV